VDRCDFRENVSVVLRKGGHSQCVRIGFHVAPDDDLGAFEKQTATHGIKTQHKTNPEPSIAEMVTFEDPKGTVMEVFKRAEFGVQAERYYRGLPDSLMDANEWPIERH